MLLVSLALATLAHADVEKTQVIDAIASKPDKPLAILLLYQDRPWDEATLDLLKQKLAAYARSVRSESFLKARPALHGKTFRIIVLYVEKPSPGAEAALKAEKDLLARENVSMRWGTDDELVSLMESP